MTHVTTKQVLNQADVSFKRRGNSFSLISTKTHFPVPALSLLNAMRSWIRDEEVREITWLSQRLDRMAQCPWYSLGVLVGLIAGFWIVGQVFFNR